MLLWSLNPAARSSATPTDRLSPNGKTYRSRKPGPRWLLTSWLKSTSAKLASLNIAANAQKRASQVGCRLQCPIKPSRLSCQQMKKWFQRMMLVRSLIAWPDAGRTGDTSMATSMMSLRARLSMTSFATCSPIKWWHLTLHSGSTPA